MIPCLVTVYEEPPWRPVNAREPRGSAESLKPPERGAFFMEQAVENPFEICYISTLDPYSEPERERFMATLEQLKTHIAGAKEKAVAPSR